MLRKEINLTVKSYKLLKRTTIKILLIFILIGILKEKTNIRESNQIINNRSSKKVYSYITNDELASVITYSLPVPIPAITSLKDANGIRILALKEALQEMTDTYRIYDEDDFSAYDYELYTNYYISGVKRAELAINSEEINRIKKITISNLQNFFTNKKQYQKSFKR